VARIFKAVHFAKTDLHAQTHLLHVLASLWIHAFCMVTHKRVSNVVVVRLLGVQSVRLVWTVLGLQIGEHVKIHAIMALLL